MQAARVDAFGELVEKLRGELASDGRKVTGCAIALVLDDGAVAGSFITDNEVGAPLLLASVSRLEHQVQRFIDNIEPPTDTEAVTKPKRRKT